MMASLPERPLSSRPAGRVPVLMCPLARALNGQAGPVRSTAGCNHRAEVGSGKRPSGKRLRADTAGLSG